MFDVFIELKEGQAYHYSEHRHMRSAFACAVAWLEEDEADVIIPPGFSNPPHAVRIEWRGEKTVFRATRWEWRQ